VIASPVGAVERCSRARYVIAFLSFGATVVLSAALVGAGLGLAGRAIIEIVPLARSAFLMVVVAVALAYGLAEVRGTRLPIPQRHWQVPKAWGVYGRSAYAALFGLALGSGMLTYVPFAGYYVLLGLCVLGADPQRGALLMVLFGLGRALPVWLSPVQCAVRHHSSSFATVASVNDWWYGLQIQTRFFRGILLCAVAGCEYASFHGLR
jgi:cytochrome c biogenesis protein CcdA